MRASYSDHLIRMPIYQIEKQNQIKHIYRELWNVRGIAPSVSEIADAMGVSEKDVQKVLDLQHDIVSLDTPIGVHEESDSTLQSTLKDEQAEDPERILSVSNMIATVTDFLHGTGDDKEEAERNLEILKLRFGIGNEGVEMSLDQVGKKIGLTRERIRQIIKRQLIALRNPARKHFKETVSS